MVVINDKTTKEIWVKSFTMVIQVLCQPWLLPLLKDSGAVLAFDGFHSFPRKGKNSMSVPSFCWWANTKNICSSGCLRAHPGSLVVMLLEGWRCSQLPSPTWSSNGPVSWLFSRSLHSPTLLKLGWVDFRVKHYLLGPAQLSPALSTLIK